MNKKYIPRKPEWQKRRDEELLRIEKNNKKFENSEMRDKWRKFYNSSEGNEIRYSGDDTGWGLN
jgi:hypothetical protein